MKTAEDPGEEFEPVYDTVFDCDMKSVFCDEPEAVHRRLMADHPPHWRIVMVGQTKELVLITEYLYEEKYRDVVKQIKELLRKKDLPMFKRDTALYEAHIERAARKMIERILDR